MPIILDWIFGIALSIFIALIMTIIISVKDDNFSGSGKVFFIFLPIGFAISVYAGLVELWIFILSFLFTIVIIYFEIKRSD